MSSVSSYNSTVRAAFSYCVNQVRSYDYHHFLCLLHLPPETRRAAFVLRAFNVETSRAMDIASDPKICLMRLLWWQETIDKIFSKKVVEHPVAHALSHVITERTISRTWLKRSVEARINDVRQEAHNLPSSVGELEKYAEDTTSTILYLTLQSGGIKSTNADHAASHIGKASGLLLLMKSLPYHARRSRRTYIPADVADKYGLLISGSSASEILMEPGEKLSEAVFDVVSVANSHLNKARDLSRKVPVEAIPALLPAVVVEVLLDSLRRSHFNVFDPRLARGILGVSPLWFHLKLKWHSWRNKY